MKHVLFGNYNSYDDLGLILTSSTIDAPSPKTNYIELDGSDGSVDYTEAFGRVFFENRKLKFDFTYTGHHLTFAEKFSELQNLLHGRKMKIIISDDPEWWYVGRITLDSWKSSKAIRKISIECDCEPYKYTNVIRVYEINSNPQSIVFHNARKNVVPTLLATAAIGVACNEKSVTLTPDVKVTDGIEFVEGKNTLVVTGSSSCSLKIECIIGS